MLRTCYYWLAGRNTSYGSLSIAVVLLIKLFVNWNGIRRPTTVLGIIKTDEE